MCELSAQLELERETSLQLAPANQQLRGLVATLVPHGLATAGVARTAAALSGEQHEQRAQAETGQKQHLSPLLQVSLCTICICSLHCVHSWWWRWRFRCLVLGIRLSLLVLWVCLSRREAGELQKAASKCLCACGGTCVHEKDAAFSFSLSMQRCRLFNTSFCVQMAGRAGFLRAGGVVFFFLFLEVAPSALDTGSHSSQKRGDLHH